MSYKNTTDDNFKKLSINGYTSKEVTLLEGENIKKILSGNVPRTGMLPACHLNFGNIGKLEFDFGLPSTDPMNLNMFNKLSRLSDIIRGINDRCVTLIEELKCCSLAELYNSLVIPIFEWVLKDFINTLVSIAESILKSYQVMKVIFCAVRPVPGNPWLRRGGVDFLKYLYSFVGGFEAVYKWLVDGNPIDYILNPAEAFYKKISSCSPDKKRNLLLQDDGLRKDDLEQLILSFNEERGQVIDQARLDLRNETNEEILIIEKQYSELIGEIDTNNNNLNMSYYSENEQNINMYLEEKKLLEDDLNKMSVKRGKLDNELEALGVVKKQDEITTEKLVNKFLAQRTLDKMIIDAYNPVCSCLLEMAGVHGYSLKNIMTLNTWESFDNKAVGRVLWADKDKWLTAIEKMKAHEAFDQNVSTIYISRYNFPEKFARGKLEIERNFLTRYANNMALNDLLGFEDFGKADIYFKSIDKTGSEFTGQFPITSEFTSYSPTDIIRVYTDSGIHSHSSTNINTIFDLNEERLIEKNKQLVIVSYLQLEKRDYEKDLETAWNILRQEALQTLSYGKYTNQEIDELIDSAGKKIYDGASDIFTGAYAAAKNLYDGGIITSNAAYNTKLEDYNKRLDAYQLLSPDQRTTEEGLQFQKELTDIKNILVQEKQNRDQEIINAKKVFSDIGKTSMDIFSKTISTITNSSETFNAIAKPAQKMLEAQKMLDRLGTSFDIIAFIDLYNPSSSDYLHVVMPNYINEKITDINTTIYKWSEVQNKIDKHNGMVSRLDTLVEIDNFMIAFVDDELQICGCDILCVILQQLLDIITSTINALIKTIIDKLMKMIMSDQATYIIKMITEKLKCYLMATEISENIKKIGELSTALKNRNKQPLTEASDPAGCVVDNSLTVQDKLYKNDEVHLLSKNTDTVMVDVNGNPVITNPILHPMPDWGTNSPNDIPEPGNALINNGATLGDSTTGRNVPELYLDCSRGKLPYIEIEIEPRTKFEILIAFIPGESILDAEVISSPQTIKDPLSGVTDINGVPIIAEDIVNPVLNLADIMEKVNKQVNAALTAPIYVENDCSPKPINNNNNITLCSRDNLIVSSIVIIEDDKIVNDNHLGKISTIKYYDSDIEVHEYYPEHKDADNNGMVLLKSNNPYWVYSVPDTTTRTLDPIITKTTEVVPGDTVINNTNTVTTHEVIEEFAQKITETIIDIFYNLNGDILEKIVTTTVNITIIEPFRKPNLELLVNFKNSVNNFKIRALLDIVAYDLDDVSIKYNANLYKGRYPEYVEMGACPAGTGHQYVISFERLLYLSTKILKANYIITNPAAVADTIPRDPIEPNKCLLPQETKDALISTDGIVDNIALAMNEATMSMEATINNLVTPVVPELPEITIAPILKSIPFLVLNKELGILVQIVNRKMYLQFPSDSFHISEPTIIDYELIPGELYMFVFNTNGLTYKMSLINADKEVFVATGMNTSLTPIQPSIIGGNETGTMTMCGGTIIDIIISKNGNNTIDYYNRSIMGYIPRLSQILFDFSLFQGSRVYNTITDIGNGYATKIPRAGSLSNEYGYGTATNLAKQQSDFYGEIISNQFYQVLDGYMDNFFCKDNLGDKDFTISLWLYNKGCRTNHHSIISDDIGKNFIYYDASAGKIVVDFFGSPVINTNMILKTWTNITLKHDKFSRTFYLVVQDIDGTRHNIEWKNKNKFSLMSLFAEYNYITKKYYRNFVGYLSTISIFMSCIDERTYKDLYKNQKILVQGMEK